jgi:hypothetical protein
MQKIPKQKDTHKAGMKFRPLVSHAATQLNPIPEY